MTQTNMGAGGRELDASPLESGTEDFSARAFNILVAYESTHKRMTPRAHTNFDGYDISRDDGIYCVSLGKQSARIRVDDLPRLHRPAGHDEAFEYVDLDTLNLHKS